MCGITGFVDFRGYSSIGDLRNMVAALSHRGPDDSGAEIFDDHIRRVGLGHARLSIIDVTPSGHQPMNYKGLSIVFNGEIYNFENIKHELLRLGHKFNSRSDTEVILHAYEEWGMESVSRFIGMFAFVIHDRDKQELVAFRDRAGVKPFYYYRYDGLFLFGSELKALRKHPHFAPEINISSLDQYFNLGYIPAPDTIFKFTHKLAPGHYLRLSIADGTYTKGKYWDVLEFYGKDKIVISYQEAKAEVNRILKSAFEYRMVSDLPVGVFLSGGYDSTAVTAILQHERTTRLKTFTIGFESGNNEAPFAKATAEYLGTDHTEYLCTERQAMDIIPMLPYFYDEPFADQSAIPTMLVSRLAKQHVSVALSADGGDEIFAGYSRYLELASRLNSLDKIPNFLKGSVKMGLGAAGLVLSDDQISLQHRIAGVINSLHIDRKIQGHRLFHYSHTLPRNIRLKLFATPILKNEACPLLDVHIFENEIEMAMAIDFKTYLQGDILAKVDRASMSVSLEGREPFLDHRIVEFVATLPFEYKHHKGQTKRILKEIVHQYVPNELMDRPKAGFSVPIFSWLRKDLSFLLDEFLSKNALQSHGFFDSNYVERVVVEFKRDNFHFKPLIWRLLMFQMWYATWMK